MSEDPTLYVTKAPAAAATEERAPVVVEDLRQQRGEHPYGENIAAPPPVDVERIPHPDAVPSILPPSRWPKPEVEVEALDRGIRDRGFIFGRGARWKTTWSAVDTKLAGKVKVIRKL